MPFFQLPNYRSAEKDTPDGEELLRNEGKLKDETSNLEVSNQEKNVKLQCLKTISHACVDFCAKRTEFKNSFEKHMLNVHNCMYVVNIL